MKLPNISTRNGFTLVEIILVLGLLTMLGGFGLFISMDFYRSYSLRASRNTLISTLHKARSQAISNIDQAPHGIRIESNQYTVFEGPTYASRTATLDEVIGAEPTVTISTISTLPLDIVFGQLDGSVAASNTVQVGSGVKIYTISINNEGAIDW